MLVSFSMTLCARSHHFWIFIHKCSITIRSAQLAVIWLRHHSTTHIAQIHIGSFPSSIIRFLTILIRTIIIIILTHLCFGHSLAQHLFIELLLFLVLNLLNERLQIFFLFWMSFFLLIQNLLINENVFLFIFFIFFLLTLLFLPFNDFFRFF